VDSQELKVVDLVSSQQVLLVKVVLQDGNQLRKGDLLGFYIIKNPFSQCKPNEFFISVKIYFLLGFKVPVNCGLDHFGFLKEW
jgi:hypothetical protein